MKNVKHEQNLIKNEAINPWLLIVKIVVIVVLTETVVMWGISSLENLNELEKIALDALLLALISAGPIWLWIIRPINRFTAEHLSYLENLENAIDSSAIVAITDVHGKIIQANDKFSDISGYTREELIGQDHRILNSKFHTNDFIKNLWTTILSGNVWRGEIRNRRKNGEYYWVYSNIVPFKNAAGKISHFYSIRYDITQQKNAEQELMLTKNEAIKATKAKTQFLANMSHEIRTPLNGILGLIDILAEEKLSPEGQKNLTIIKSNSHVLLELLNDILDFSKIEANKTLLENVPTNLNLTINDIVALFRSKCSENGNTLKVHFDAHSPEQISVDATKVKQILTNLVSNAVKFTQNGEIKITTKIISSNLNKIKMQISVTDTGIGIPANMQHKLFQSFSQVDGSTTRQFGGTGLGLAICKGLVSAIGGEIGVNSQSGRGTEFWFTFIASVLAKENSIQTPVIEAPRAQKRIAQFFPHNILVAEDNNTNQIIIKRFLQKLGYEPDFALNGNDVLRAIQNKKYDLIFMDLHMPELDGIAATYQIRNYLHRNDIWIIALTASASKEVKSKCLKTGMNDFIAKPFQISEIASAITNFAIISNLKKLFAGSEDILVEAARQYHQSWPELFTNLKQALHTGDNESAFKLAHKLRGTASHFQYNELNQTLAAIELDCEANHLANAQVQLLNCEQQLIELQNALLFYQDVKQAA